MPSIDDMFPSSPREHFEKATLTLQQVVCNVQFPRVLRLENESPAAFQDSIKQTFPLYERGQVIGVPPAVQIPQQVLQLMAAQTVNPQHQFLTEDRKSAVALTPETLTFTSRSYKSWESFRSELQKSLNALNRDYRIPFFSRISLRYVNVINKNQLGLASRPWSSLLKTEFIGKFPLELFEDHTQQIAQRMTMSLPDGTGTVTIQHGFVIVLGTPSATGRSYMLDFDFHHQPKIETKDAEPKLDHFHELAGRLFRWCINDELRTALGPIPIPARNDDTKRVVNAPQQ
jgi:uncharacterized protein (TIGR04255 family)